MSEKHDILGIEMSQAKVLTEAELKRVLAVVAQHGVLSARNRLVVMLSFLGGLRAGEIASLKLRHVRGGGNLRRRVGVAETNYRGSS